VTISDVIGVETARRGIRAFCLAQGLSRHRAEELVIVVSELATNLVRYAAGGGQITWQRVDFERRPAIEVECTDNGPGIADLEKALREGFSSGGGLGGGLSAVQRLVDDFQIESSPDATTILVRKYL
jgi:serine/threonine-protein kinase RsbT